MTCNNCGHENASAKKSCERCFSILSGYVQNNVTGKFGFRHPDGSFTPDDSEETTLSNLFTKELVALINVHLENGLSKPNLIDRLEKILKGCKAEERHFEDQKY